MLFELHPSPVQAALTRSRAGSASSRDTVPPTECHQGSHGCRGDSACLSVTWCHWHSQCDPPPLSLGAGLESHGHLSKNQHCTTATTTSAKAFNRLWTMTEKQMTYNNNKTLGLLTFLLKNSNKCYVLTKRELGCPCTSHSGHLTTLFWGKRKRSLNSILIPKDHKPLITTFQ